MPEFSDSKRFPSTGRASGQHVFHRSRRSEPRAWAGRWRDRHAHDAPRTPRKSGLTLVTSTPAGRLAASSRSPCGGHGFGGFVFRAAAAAATEINPGSIRVSLPLRDSELDLARRSLPGSVKLIPVVPGQASGNIQRDSLDGRGQDSFLEGCEPAAALRDGIGLDALPLGAFRSSLLAVNRVSAELLAELISACEECGTMLAVYGADSVPAELERKCPMLIVDAGEAAKLLGWTFSVMRPATLALALAQRCARAGAVRVVIGRDHRTVAVAHNQGSYWGLLEADHLGDDRGRNANGGEDVFASRFLTAALLDAEGFRRPQPALAAALQHARLAQAGFGFSGLHLSKAEIATALANRPECRSGGSRAIRLSRIAKPSRAPGRIALSRAGERENPQAWQRLLGRQKHQEMNAASAPAAQRLCRQLVTLADSDEADSVCRAVVYRALVELLTAAYEYRIP
jgi:hypothetical protein